VRSLGLAEIAPFDPNKKIIEYLLRNPKNTRLISMTVKDFTNETASDSPAPGGGSIAALAGALGAALGTMVANLSATKRGWEDRVMEFSPWAEKGQKLKDELLFLVDEDTRAFDGIMAAFGLPKDNPEQVAARKLAIENASKYATEIPFRTMQAAFNCIPLLQEMANNGNQNSLSDVGVGAICIKTAVRGAWLNVLINANGLTDKTWAAEIVDKAKTLLAENHKLCDNIVNSIEEKLAFKG
jgi:glutamate formiminotransferase/formiminotetrahydrofolate cyclodeaminase